MGVRTMANSTAGVQPNSLQPHRPPATVAQQMQHRFPQSQNQSLQSLDHRSMPMQQSTGFHAQPQMQFSQPQPGSQLSAHPSRQAHPMANGQTACTYIRPASHLSSSVQPNNPAAQPISRTAQDPQKHYEPQPHQRLPVNLPNWQTRPQASSYSGNPPGSQQPVAAGAQAQGDSVLREQLSRTAVEKLALQEQLRKAPAADAVLQENASLRRTLQELQEQVKFRDTEVCVSPRLLGVSHIRTVTAGAVLCAVWSRPFRLPYCDLRPLRSGQRVSMRVHEWLLRVLAQLRLGGCGVAFGWVDVKGV